MFAAGAAVQLVRPRQAAAHAVRQPALLGDMVLEIRGRLHSVLPDNGKHMSRDAKLPFFFFLNAFTSATLQPGERRQNVDFWLQKSSPVEQPEA